MPPKPVSSSILEPYLTAPLVPKVPDRAAAR